MYVPSLQYKPPGNTPALHTHTRRDTSNAATTGAVIAIIAAVFAFAFLMAKAWSRNRELKMAGTGNDGAAAGEERQGAGSAAMANPFMDYYPRIARHSHPMTSRRQGDDEEQLPAYEPPTKPVATAETTFNMQVAAENGGEHAHQQEVTSPEPPNYSAADAQPHSAAHVPQSPTHTPHSQHSPLQAPPPAYDGSR